MKELAITLILISFSFSSLAQLTTEEIDIDGVERTYLQYLPTGFDPSTEDLPVVFILHGLGGTAAGMTTGGEMNAIADTARFIPLYLQGLPNLFGQNAWNNGTAAGSSANDILFISSLLDSINAHYSVNLDRVYMMGISMGSIMTYHACNYLSDRIAAVACHIGTMSDADADDFAPLYPVPTMHIHGTADDVVPYDGAALPTLSLIPKTIETLKVSHGFTGDSTITNIPDNAADGVTIEKIEYEATTHFELWKMTDAGHIFLIPGVNDTSGYVISWHFFNQFTHPSPSSLGTDIDYHLGIELFPNPTADQIFIKSDEVLENIEIYSVNGTIVQTQATLNIGESIDVSNLDNGYYFFKATTKSGITYRTNFAKAD